MADFSWSDSLQAALAPCVGCFRSRPNDDDASEHGPEYVPRARPDELEGLLADADADADADTMSLHSNVGSAEERRRRRAGLKKPKGSIKLFGFYLFGRPPIHLPDDEDEHNLDGNDTHTHGRIGYQDRARTISASTLDSDASPLDPSAINALSAARAAQQRELDRVAKEERRRRRKARKQAEREELSRALDEHGDEFEGFQASIHHSVRCGATDTLMFVYTGQRCRGPPPLQTGLRDTPLLSARRVRPFP